MFRKTKIGAAALAAVGGSLGMGSVLFVAPTTAQAQSDQRIVVTGSLIRRIDGESALPVTTLRVDDLQRAGATNAESVVTFITQAQGGSVTSGSVSGTNGAASYASLRSLGAGRTLVLLNGKRVVPNPYAAAAVDLNTLPSAALERVETLSDGASAVYGTDAIAGVINFITRREYRGLALSASAQVPAGGGGDVYTGDIMGGIGNFAADGWNIFGAINYRNQKPMNGTEREFMRTSYQPERGFNGLSPTTFPANYSQAGTIANTNPSLPAGCQPISSISAPEANGTRIRCFADTQTFTNVVPIQEQTGVFLRGSLALGANHTASLEYTKTQNRVETQIAPSPEGGLTMTPLSPYYPGKGITPITNTALNPNANLAIAWRTTVLGSRRGEQVNDTQRAVASLEGTALDWDYSASLLWSNAKVVNSFLNGYPMTVPLRNGVQGLSGAPFLNPFGDQSAAGLAYMQTNQVLGKVQEGEGTLQSLSATASRSLFSLPGGAATLGLSTEFRQEEMVYNTDVAKVSQAASSGLAGQGAQRAGDRDITAVGLELALPVLKGLEIGLAVRSDRYSDFGNTTNPKISLKYNLTSPMLFRASVNTGFSAPSLSDLYSPNATTFTGNRYNDPLLCPNGVATAQAVPSRDCGIQFQRLTGGNDKLKAEESKAWTVGLVFQPTPTLSFGVDYWAYEIKDSISTIGDATVFGDPVKYASYFVRCSQAPTSRTTLLGACQNLVAGVDPLAYVLDTNQNLGDVKTSGFDAQVNWNSGATPNGRFSVGIRSTYVHKYHFQLEPGGAWFEPVGNYLGVYGVGGTSGGTVLRYKQVSTFGWENDAWSVRFTNRYQNGYRDQNAQGAPFNVAPFNTNKVAPYSTWDTSLAYRGVKGLALTFGILNILNTDPSFTNQTARFQARGYDDRYSTPLGRTYQLSARYEF